MAERAKTARVAPDARYSRRCARPAFASSSSPAWLAAAKSKTGDVGPEAFDQPLEAAVASGSRSTEGLVRLQRAVALAAAGSHDQAVPDFERSIALFAGYGGLPNLARAHHAYGQALEAVGDRDGSTAHLRTAEQMFTDLGIQPDLVGG